MLWLIETYYDIWYTFYTYFNIDISTFTDAEKVQIILLSNLVVLLTIFLLVYIFKHIIYKFFTIIG